MFAVLQLVGVDSGAGSEPVGSVTEISSATNPRRALQGARPCSRPRVYGILRYAYPGAGCHGGARVVCRRRRPENVVRLTCHLVRSSCSWRSSGCDVPACWPVRGAEALIRRRRTSSTLPVQLVTGTFDVKSARWEALRQPIRRSGSCWNALPSRDPDADFWRWSR